jgi:hypothetical protein
VVTINNSSGAKQRRIADDGTMALRSALRDVGGWEEEAIRMSPTALRRFAISRIASNIEDNSGIFPEGIVKALKKTPKRLLRMDNGQIADNYVSVVGMVNSYKVYVRLLYEGQNKPETSINEKVKELEKLSRITYSHLADTLLTRDNPDTLLTMKRKD